MSGSTASTPPERTPPRLTCRWCRRPFELNRRGRPREFCKRSCRQRDFEARARAAAHGLDEAELIITRESLNQLQDTIYVLQCAVEDVDRDFPGGLTRADRGELLDALRWVLEAARPVTEHLGIR